jgi:predicted nicotinamide N-methyase
VLCSKSATTDFDLTGQIIWPSAIDLGRFIIDNALLFKGKNVLELGAGAGLSGIVAYQYA